ncbi:unnamed protein product [Heterosigma akashiwo]|mmetsp:Transcript_32891/g.56782  ORF Transcript_32891/g.56782 Transcript_32891/m.56782 type:complete len:81 (-) Transcript_32891:206-448(-)
MCHQLLVRSTTNIVVVDVLLVCGSQIFVLERLGLWNLATPALSAFGFFSAKKEVLLCNNLILQTATTIHQQHLPPCEEQV